MVVGNFGGCVDVEVNPASNIKSRIEERAGTRWLSVAEIKSLAPHLEALPPAKRDALKLILLTGQRPGEVAGMRTGEVDLVKGVWTIPAERSKNKREHAVPLVGEARAVVVHLIENARKDELIATAIVFFSYGHAVCAHCRSTILTGRCTLHS